MLGLSTLRVQLQSVRPPVTKLSDEPSMIQLLHSAQEGLTPTANPDPGGLTPTPNPGPGGLTPTPNPNTRRPSLYP